MCGGMPTTRGCCRGRGARRVTACHSQCLRTGPRPAYLSAEPAITTHSGTRHDLIKSFKGRLRPLHTPTPHVHHAPAVHLIVLHFIIGKPLFLARAYYL